jgi:hypothetical protein
MEETSKFAVRVESFQSAPNFCSKNHWEGRQPSITRGPRHHQTSRAGRTRRRPSVRRLLRFICVSRGRRRPALWSPPTRDAPRPSLLPDSPWGSSISILPHQARGGPGQRGWAGTAHTRARPSEPRVEGHRPSTAETAANLFKARELTAAEDLVETTSSASINGEAKEGSEGPVAAPAARRHGKGDVQAAATAGGGTGGSFRHRQGGSGLRGGHGVVCRVGERS